MNRFREYVKVHFDFLKQFDYALLESDNVNIVSFAGEKNQIDVTFSEISYELSCQFIDDNRTFSLQDGLTYEAIDDYKGMYQIASKEKMENGIVYLAKAVKALFGKIDVSNPFNFQKIYQYRMDTQKKLLEKYYLETDLKKAENYWKKAEYEDAKELFEKNIEFLSATQLKKLEYILKQGV